MTTHRRLRPALRGPGASAILARGSPFRGYGDPSLEHDPATGTLWLSYAWLEARVESGCRW